MNYFERKQNGGQFRMFNQFSLLAGKTFYDGLYFFSVFSLNDGLVPELLPETIFAVSLK